MIRFTLLLFLTLVTLAGARELPPAYYLIGNSLTWDTVPARIDGDVQWHVDCGKPIAYIHAHPEKPCVKTSTLWPKALKAKQYTYLSVQPHYDASVTSAAEAIGHWIRLQPNAIHVTHSGGRYLMHNCMRHALNQPRSSKGFEKIDPKLKTYLDGVLDTLKP
tara:strand:- start:138 stop:623 length:486 start_codon:yes stop_codon:yes gene_type:complete